MADKYLVVIIWDYYETSEIEFDTYIEAWRYFDVILKEYGTVENIYLTKVLVEVKNEL